MRQIIKGMETRAAVLLATGAAVFGGGLAIEGCTSGGQSTQTTTVEIPNPPHNKVAFHGLTQAEQKDLSSSAALDAYPDISEVAAFIKMKGTRDHDIALLLANSQAPTVQPEDFVSTFKSVDQVAGHTGRVSFLFPDKSGPLTIDYDVMRSPEKSHYIIFAPPMQPGERPAYTAIREPRAEKYPTVTVLADLGDQPTRFDDRVSGNNYDLAVELCNSLTGVEPTKESKARIAKLLQEQTGQNFNAGALIVLNQIGMELTCNSFAAAISFAKTGIPYNEYAKTMHGQRLKALGQALAGYYHVVPKDTYDSFAQHPYKK